MANYHQLNPLTNRQQDICSYAGTFGALLALTCLIHHIMITRAHWITYTLAIFYVFVIIAFILLAFQYRYAPLLLIVSAVLSMLAEAVVTLSAVFSLVVLLLFLYNVVVVVFLYVEQLPARLKEKDLAIKAEREEWDGKI